MELFAKIANGGVIKFEAKMKMQHQQTKTQMNLRVAYEEKKHLKRNALELKCDKY